MIYNDILVKVNAHTRNQKEYLNKGYSELNGFFFVHPNDLPDHSGAQEIRKCDLCNKDFIRRHEHHVVTNKRFNMDICGECVNSNKETKNIINQKKISSWEQIYGGHPMNNPSIKEKVEKTFIEKYNGHPMKNEEIKEKFLRTVNEKYGGNSPQCDQLVREKSINTLSKYGEIPTSSQQLEIFNLLSSCYQDCFLNYIEGVFALDVLVIVDNIKIDIEYDGKYWHRDQQKDRKRDEVLKSKGYKILRIKGGHKIPTLEKIQENIDYLLKDENNNYSSFMC